MPKKSKKAPSDDTQEQMNLNIADAIEEFIQDQIDGMVDHGLTNQEVLLHTFPGFALVMSKYIVMMERATGKTLDIAATEAIRVGVIEAREKYKREAN